MTIAATVQMGGLVNLAIVKIVNVNIMARVKFDKDKPTHERTHKHTSIGGGRIKTSSMNKSKRRYV